LPLFLQIATMKNGATHQGWRLAWWLGCLLAGGLVSCGESATETNVDSLAFDADLAAEISQRSQRDQAAQQAVWTGSPLDRDSLLSAWDEVIEDNCSWLQSLLADQGFPAFDQVGPEAAHACWVLVLHCKDDLLRQPKLLQEMRRLVATQQADAEDWAYLADEVAISQGKRQQYGTHVIYDHTGQAVPLEIAQTDSVESRRARLGLDSLGTYLRRATDLHREIYGDPEP
jgi:hypothetical protein